MSSVRKSFAYAAVGKYAEFFLFLLGTIVLSRILTPADIGLFAAANSIVAFAQNIRHFGTGDYLIQKEDLQQKDTERALGISMFFSWGIAIILALFSGTIAQYFEEPKMANILLIVAVSFVFMPISSVADARLARDMKFGIKSIISILSSSTNLIVATSLALSGYGALSIAWATLATNVAMLVFSFIFAYRYVTLKPLFTGIQAIFTFGSWVAATGIIRNIGHNGYILIISKMLSFELLGIYMRAATVVERFSVVLLDIIRSVAMPSFSELKRNNEDPAPALINAFSLMAGFLWPFYGFVALHAEPIVLILFGWQWTTAIPIVQILAVAVILSMNMTALMPTVLTAYGRVKFVFTFNLINTAIRIVGVIYAAQYGLVSVAYLVMISTVLGALFYSGALIHLFKNVRLIDLISIHARAATLTIVSLTPSVAILYWAKQNDWHHISTMVISGSVGFVLWFIFSGKFIPAILKEKQVFLVKFGEYLPLLKRYI